MQGEPETSARSALPSPGFTSGQTSVAIPVSAVGPGTSTITASANGGQATATVNVNAPPTVSITAPAPGAVFNTPANVTVNATAADSDGTVAKVDFFDGTTGVGTATASPYSVTLANLASGTHTLTARATDNRGAATTSAAVSIIVNTPPTVSITVPAANAVFTAPASITITAAASDTDGTVAKVDFYQGTTLIGTATGAPFTFNWTNVAAGTYSLTAVATDNQGATTTSSAVSISVVPNTPPTVSLTSPANGASFKAPASVTLTANASDSDGTVSQVEFFQGATRVATVTTAPYTFTVNNLGQGSYTFSAVATDDKGATTTSNTVTISVTPAQAQVFYIYTDQLNTPRVITDQTNKVVWRWDNQDPFGANVPNDDPNSTGNHFSFNPRFPGQYFDRETNLAYNYFRDYDPGTGRYVQSDPIGLRGGINTYAYVHSAPIAAVDPSGLKCVAGVGCWTTPEERAILENGNVVGYYQAACVNGDEYACFAGHIAANDNFWGHVATGRIVSRLRERAAQTKQCIDVARILDRVRVDLATGYANSLPKSQQDAQWPTVVGVTQLHWDEFAKVGLPPETFGGTPFGKQVGPVFPSLWCPNCR